VSTHLRVRIGAYGILIPAGAVLDVWTEAVTPAVAPTWRGRVLPFVDGRALLGEPAQVPPGVLTAYGAAADDPKIVILGLDEVLGSVSVGAERLRPFPPNLADAHRLFDGIATLPGETRSLLRLRFGLDLAALTEIRLPAPSSA
jgi:chemotaxis signal transduction protein